MSEAGHEKSVTVAELCEKGSLTVRTVKLTPLHDMREIKGSYLGLPAKSYYDGTKRDDYLHITLTDEEDVPDGMNKLSVIYPNLMKLDYDNRRTSANAYTEPSDSPENKTPLELFREFYQKQNNSLPGKEQEGILRELIEKIWEEKQ